MADPQFCRDLYRGTAQDYERFRVPYPPGLIDGLARRAGADGTGRLLDLACGTGQLALALRGYFRDVWAVDQEPDMISAVARLAGAGDAPWQLAVAATMGRWRDRAAGGAERVPAGYEQDRRERPDAMILRDCGFEAGPSWSIPVAHERTVETLTGFMFSTAVLSRAALGALAPELAADLRRELLGCAPDGRFRQVISFGCELARRPV